MSVYEHLSDTTLTHMLGYLSPEKYIDAYSCGFITYAEMEQLVKIQDDTYSSNLWEEIKDILHNG